jgi:hypothetical protein
MTGALGYPEDFAVVATVFNLFMNLFMDNC